MFAGRKARLRTGCLTCRGAKKKCDMSKPDCDRCQKHGRTCKWPELASSRIVETQSQVDCVSYPLLHLLETLSKTAGIPQFAKRPLVNSDYVAIPLHIDRSPDELSRGMNGQLIRYYSDSASHKAAVFDNDNNIFSTTFLQLAIQGLSQGSTALIYCILSYAASHYAQSTPSFTSVALELHGRAMSTTSEVIRHLHQQRGRISQQPRHYEAWLQYALAATLLLCSTEITRGETSTWLVHHQATKSLLQMRAPGELASVYIRMLRMFAYHDCLALTTDPIFDQELWRDVLRNVEVPLRASSPDHDCLMGAAGQVFYYISFIRRLECECDALPRPAIVNQIIHIIRGLDRWTLSCDVPPEYIKVAEAYRAAAQIRLHHLARRWQYVVLAKDEVARLSESIVDACADAPGASILWPLAMAAPFAGFEKRRVIREYLEEGKTKHGLAHFERAGYVFEALWTARSQGDDVTFEDILRIHNWSLSLT